MKERRNRRIAGAAAVAMALAALPAGALADARDLFFERAVVVEADARCRLFAPAVSSALKAAAAQARGAALRAGGSDVELADRARDARARAAAVACADPSLKTIQTRVEGAFAGWTQISRMTFPGARNTWAAERTLYRSAGWRLVQDTTIRHAAVRFGVSGGLRTPEQLAATVQFPGRSRPYAARIVLRDTAKAPRPWFGRSGLPPKALTRVIWSSGFAAAEPTLLAAKAPGETWRFPAEALAALEALDPRETFTIEFVFRDDSVATAALEAGDLSAARAFLAMGTM